jgi:hypothetical protein
MLARENHLFGCTRSKPSQSSVPADLTPTSDFGFCFQCQAGPSLVLHRPIEITAQTGQVESSQKQASGNANLLLVRASLRERELAVRAALGASWWNLAGPMLAEAFLLAILDAKRRHVRGPDSREGRFTLVAPGVGASTRNQWTG